MEVMGLMLGHFVDDYTITCVDVFAMPQVQLLIKYKPTSSDIILSHSPKEKITHLRLIEKDIYFIRAPMHYRVQHLIVPTLKILL